MAHGRKTGGRNFQKGQSGNPKGMNSKGITEARKLNKALVTELLNKFINMPTCDLVDFVRRNTKEQGSDPTIETLVASILIKAINEGDQARLNFILDRLIGKVTDKVEHSLPVPTIVRRFESKENVMLASRSQIIDVEGEEVDE